MTKYLLTQQNTRDAKQVNSAFFIHQEGTGLWNSRPGGGLRLDPQDPPHLTCLEAKTYKPREYMSGLVGDTQTNQASYSGLFREITCNTDFGSGSF